MNLEAWLTIGLTLLGLYTAWMTKMAIGLNEIRALVHRMDKVEERVDSAHGRLAEHDIVLTRLGTAPRAGDAG